MFENGLWTANPFLALFIVLVVAMVTSTLTAVIIERVAYRPLRGAPRLIPLITSIGMSFFVQYTFAGLFGVGFSTYPQAPEILAGSLNILGLQVRTTQAAVILIAILSMIGLWYFVTKTRTGRAIRAVAEDKEIAGLMGINVDRAIVSVFAVGGAMAGVAALMWSLLFRSVNFFTGFFPGIKAFTAAVLGGIGNIAGAMGGGVLLGLFEGVGPLLILGGLGIPGVSQLKDAVAFVALVLVLVFRPSGLFGERLGSEDRV
jgi:branched-chain amino acid transport system permease protein